MSIFDNAPVGVLVYAQKGQKLLYANAYAKTFLLEDGNVYGLHARQTGLAASGPNQYATGSPPQQRQSIRLAMAAH